MRHQTGRHLPEGVYVARRHQSNRRVTLADALSWKAGGWIGKDGRWKRGKRHRLRRGEEAEGWRERVWKEKARLFPGAAMPYLILDLRREISYRICVVFARLEGDETTPSSGSFVVVSARWELNDSYYDASVLPLTKNTLARHRVLLNAFNVATFSRDFLFRQCEGRNRNGVNFNI